MYARLQIALWSAAVVGGLTLSDSDAAVVAAKPKPKSQSLVPASIVPAAANSTHHSQVLTELHQAKTLLDHANHAYNGHRAKADHEITRAIHILHHEHHKKSTTAAKSAAAKPAHQKAVHESQQASDTQLRQAEKLVHAAILELHKHRHDEKAHHASKLLHEAVHEIELAIHLHHKHHNKNGVAKI
jgi:hypothetical protein